MRPVVLKYDGDGKIHITAEEIEKMLQDAYDDGYKDGKNSVPQYTPITAPSNAPITPYSPYTPTWLETDHTITCKND